MGEQGGEIRKRTLYEPSIPWIKCHVKNCAKVGPTGQAGLACILYEIYILLW